LLDLARRADRVHGQEQRLSTSLEVQARGGPTSLVAALLVQDAERRATELDWGLVGRTPWPRWAWPVVATLFAVSVAATAVPVPDRVVRVAGGAPVPIVDADRAARDAESVARFAELLSEVSQAEDSPYLQAVAASFADLAERITDGTIDAVEASRALEELVGHLREAAREVSPAFAEAVGAAFANTAAGAALGDEPPSSDGASAEAGSSDGDPTAPAGEVPAVDPAAAANASMYLALEDLAGEMTENAGGLGLRTQRPQALDPLSEDAFYGGVLNAETDPNAAPAEPSGFRVQADGAGDAVGGAEQSSERAGDAIGGGSADLGGGSDGFLGLDAETVAGEALPWNEREDGRYVEVELVPDAVMGEARPFARDVAAAPFVRADEAASTARTVGATYRSVVGRYFMPGAVQAGGTP
jgi:hypothetical protein